MEITYSESREIGLDEIRSLFETVDWQVRRYPEKIVSAIPHYARIYTAWDGEKLIGLICSLDDGAITAYIHYLLVHPDYRGRGVGKTLLRKMLAAYEGFLRVELVADPAAVGYYASEGFKTLDAVSMCRFQ